WVVPAPGGGFSPVAPTTVIPANISDVSGLVSSGRLSIDVVLLQAPTYRPCRRANGFYTCRQPRRAGAFDHRAAIDRSRTHPFAHCRHAGRRDRHDAARRGRPCGHRAWHRRIARPHAGRTSPCACRSRRPGFPRRIGTGQRAVGVRLAAASRFEAASTPQVSRTILPAYRRDSSAVSAALASGNGKTFATRGLSRPAFHQRNSSARLRLIRAGSRSAWAPQTTPMTETFLTRIRL